MANEPSRSEPVFWGLPHRPAILVAPVPTSVKDARELARELLGSAWPRVRRIALIRQEVRESLSTSALDLLFQDAELIVEGARGTHEGGQGQGYATVMVTVDLARAAALLRERADEATAERVTELMRGSAVVRRRLIDMAKPRLAQLFGVAARTMRVELLPVVRFAGTKILIDGDAVVTLRQTATGELG